jgi:hypothetical protein
MILSIVSPSDGAVKPRRHSRIPASIFPRRKLTPRSGHSGGISQSIRKGRGVHIPAMKNADFGQVLRTLELTRAFN